MTAPVLLGAGFGFGLLVFVAGVAGLTSGRRGASSRGALERVQFPVAATGIAAIFGLMILLVTGWPAGAGLAAMAVIAAPRVSAARRGDLSSQEVAEAVAGWAAMLRDTMAAAAGIEQAVAVTAPLAPSAIRPATLRLAGRLEHDRLVPSLRAFAEEVEDASADLVVSALVLATRHSAGDLGALLGALADSTRGHAEMVRRVDAGRSRLRTATRVVIATTLGFAGLLVVANREFLAPYDDGLGQAWLLVIGGVFATAMWQLDRLARVSPRPRVLAGVASEEGN